MVTVNITVTYESIENCQTALSQLADDLGSWHKIERSDTDGTFESLEILDSQEVKAKKPRKPRKSKQE